MKSFILTIAMMLMALTFVLSSCKKEEEEVKQIERSTVTDIDGNVYVTVKIGDQWWMAENLRVSKFNDGTELILISEDMSDSIWANADSPSYCYLNDGLNGFLYNGKTVTNGKNIAPSGWHVATDDEWKKLETTIEMKQSDVQLTGWRGENEGEKLASKYSVGWPEGGELFGTDEYGFNALPGGCRIQDGRTNIFGNTCFWWTQSLEGDQIWYRYLDNQKDEVFRQHTYLEYGMSIRCVKD
jgi:uncharacterized protein (TIGR02145 family)